MDPAVAAQILEALDVELAKRQAPKDEAEDKRWAEGCQGDEIILMARKLSRAWDRPRPQVQVPTSREDIECLTEQVEDYAKTLLTLANAADRDERRKVAEAAGALNQRQAIVIGPRRSQTAAPTKKRPVALFQRGFLNSMLILSDDDSRNTALLGASQPCRRK